MTKRCVGCGSILQNNNVNEKGFTPNLENDFCMRCFKLTHYNELTNTSFMPSNEKLLENINKSNNFVIFLVDFLNITNYVIDTYKKISNEKILVITKSDLIPKNIILNTLERNIKNIYNIKENIYFISTKNARNISTIDNICKIKKSILLAGFTSSGKSSLINKLMNANITVSNYKNTTQDFIKLQNKDYTIYDAPGFTITSIDDFTKTDEVLPITYQIDPKYYLSFEAFNLYFSDFTNITIFMKKRIIKKRLKKEDINYSICVPSNYDLIIIGLGFVRFSKATYISINIDNDLYEIRPSIIGGQK